MLVAFKRNIFSSNYFFIMFLWCFVWVIRLRAIISCYLIFF